MKRIVQFILVFSILLIGAYAKPILLPKHLKQQTVVRLKKEPSEKKQHVFKPSKAGALKTMGFSEYINQPTELFTKKYGEPIEIQENYFGNQWWIFGEDEHDYLQLEVKKNKIVSIFVLGDTVDVVPLKMNMTMNEVAALTTISSNFNSEYKGQHYDFELTEQDMNYRPLLAFDNDSFAMLHFSQSSGKLLGIRYLNNELLLRLMPYQLNEMIDIEEQDEPNNMEEIKESSDRQLEMMIKIMRKKLKLSPYNFSPAMRVKAEETLTEFLKSPQHYLENESRINEWEMFKTNRNVGVYRQCLKLTSAEYHRLINDRSDDSHGFLIKPSQDIPYTLMSIFSDLSSQRHFLNAKDNEIGIATDNVNFIVMISNNKIEAETMISDKIELITSEDGK